MSKLRDLFKMSRPAAVKTVSVRGSVPESVDPEDLKGIDERRLAELRAEAAGECWRKHAEETGEIQKETGGPKGLEPTRYGDWEKAGRCFDF